jgi:urea transporter
MESKKYQLTKEDFNKIAKGAMIAVGSALATYLQTTISEIDFGSWTPLVVAFNGILINAAQKYLTSNTYQN